jgi:hypothetical protein
VSARCTKSARIPILARTRQERGSALAIVLMITVVLTILGMGIIVLGETESLQSRLSSDRQRSREAATAVVQLVAGWFAVPDQPAVLPPKEAWRLDARRGDVDGDGTLDAACDGREPAGRWKGFPLAPTPPESIASLIAQGCGSTGEPDLLMEDGAWLERLARSLGDDVVIERIAVSGARDAAGTRGLDVTARVAIKRGPRVGARITATGRVRLLPLLPCDEAIAAGGNVQVAEGAVVRWGAIRAAGDVRLPPLTSESFPWSGLPRRADGAPVNYRTGGVIDWHASTAEREYVLTELIGRTIGGTIVTSREVVVPELADPWMVVEAGGRAILGSSPAPKGRQPWPYDPRYMTVSENLSFITQDCRGYEPFLGGRFDDLATLVRPGVGCGGRLRFFVLDAPSSGEARWREGGIGAARTADEWLGGPDGDPVIAVFSAGCGTPPERVTLSGARGVVLVEARRLVLAGKREPVVREVNMPGEPFYDSGVDADGDGESDPATIGNGRWDVDADGDRVPDQDASNLFMFGTSIGPSFRVPNDDRDPALQPIAPHEPFLNFEWPKDETDGPVRVRFRAELEGLGAPVRDEDGDSVMALPGEVTSVGCDAVGALVRLPLHVQGIVANLAGDIVVEEGCQVFGSLRASGSVDVRKGASVRFDGALARHGMPDVAGVPRAILAEFAGSPRVGVARRPEADAPPPPEGGSAPAAASSPVAPGSSPPGAPRGEAGGQGRGRPAGNPSPGPVSPKTSH